MGRPTVTEPWDTLDIYALLEASLDGFAAEFYKVESFDQVRPPAKKKILRSLVLLAREWNYAEKG